VGWTINQALFAVMPVYAVQLGADPASTGNYMALAFGALTVGTLTAGWLSTRFQYRRTAIIGAALLSIPVTWLMGQVAALWQLFLLTAVVFFLVGLDFTAITILAGLFAEVRERGKVFGLLALNTSLGALIGGAISGPLVQFGGYPLLFGVAGVCWIAQPAVALFLQDKKIIAAKQGAASGAPAKLVVGSAFYLLLAANVIAFGSNVVAGLGRPLVMNQLGFDIVSISSAVAVSGAVSLPFPLLLGWLSDRVDRSLLIAFCFFANMLGLVVLAASVSLWHFWLSAILLASVGVTFGIGPALMVDLVPPESMGTALAWYGFSPTVGGLAGFVLTGYAFTAFGETPTLVAAALLSLVAVVLATQVQRARRASLVPSITPSDDRV
jgi:MFS family permease